MTVIKEALQSKKAMAMICAVLLSALSALGLPAGLAQLLITILMGGASAYCLGQGMADWGKHAEAVRQAMKDKDAN